MKVMLSINTIDNDSHDQKNDQYNIDVAYATHDIIDQACYDICEIINNAI